MLLQPPFWFLKSPFNIKNYDPGSRTYLVVIQGQYVDFLDLTIGSMINFLVPGAVMLLFFGVHKCILGSQNFSIYMQSV